MVMPHQRERLFTLTLDDSFAVQGRVMIGRHTDEKVRSLSYTKGNPAYYSILASHINSNQKKYGT
ncbi:hypothetical protein PAXRUDRAFT_373188 [Paxillus rubicundulus Ve08.2h10]|uniref:Uncharacterized protein n=1 Tax=Paxillus rubicundulus Ve08.2h10 TaxID=930991 RepID=A0A0D0DHP8_9AGAM|nr:hypothetical protein PAXRUDRAFT_373188 [Paxillus rubicundulus Ve08.2h10]